MQIEELDLHHNETTPGAVLHFVGQHEGIMNIQLILHKIIHIQCQPLLLLNANEMQNVQGSRKN